MAWSGSAASGQVVHAEAFDAPGDIEEWTVMGPTYSSKEWNPTGNDSSGALLVRNEATVEFGGAQFQLCLPAQHQESFAVHAAGRIPFAQQRSGKLSIVLNFTTNPDCFGSFTGTGAASGLITIGGAPWELLTAQIPPAPIDAQSLAIRVLLVKTEGGGDLHAVIDDVLVEKVTGIFSDGFESGNTGNWSVD